jgi:hypothetical protein
MFHTKKKENQSTTYVQHNTVASSRKAYTSSAIQMAWYISLEYSTFMAISCRRQQQTSLYPPVKCPTFFPDFNQICNFSTDSHQSPQYQIWRKTLQWESQWYMRTGRLTVRYHFSQGQYFIPVALRPNAGHGLLILEVSRSHTTHYSR